MAKSIPLGLGVQAEDILTGMKGIVSARLDQISGNTQWAIQPKGKGDNNPEGHFFDAMSIKVTGKGLSDSVVPAQSSNVKLGNAIRSKATGEEGIAYERLTYMNGCVNYTVKMQAKRGKRAESFMCMSVLAEVISGGLAIEAPEKVTGGPSQSMRGYSSR